MAGRRPKPTQLKILNGNPGKRPLNQNEPQPRKCIPRMPKWLKAFPIAVKEWKRESKELNDMGIMTSADTSALANRCFIASEIQQMAFDIKIQGRMVFDWKLDKEGNEIVCNAKPNPLLSKLTSLLAEYRHTNALFGFDPSSRSRINVVNKPKKSKAEEFMSRKSKGKNKSKKKA